MSDEEKIVEKIAIFAQDCVRKHPVIILGSGASIAHGLKGMGELAQFLIENIEVDYGEEGDSWLLIKTALTHGDGLEETLLKTAAPISLVRKIVHLTWQAIAEDDLALMGRAARGEERFNLSKLLQGIFKSVHMVTHIVTPNYDRVAEYATDMAGYFHTSGFAPGIIRLRDGNSPISIRKGSDTVRTVKIWKVHGSLDWFIDSKGRIMSLPISGKLPREFEPLIVTPGVSKYERVHDEPFRSAIQGADRALEQAASLLCIGYGFRDRHIQPQIIERCRQRNIPILVLAHTLTEEAKSFLKNGAGQAYMALEKNGNGTRIFSPSYPEGTTISKPDLWSFNSFNDMVL